MPHYEIVGGPPDARVHGENWLTALGEALGLLGLDKGAMGRLVIEVGRTGEVDFSDPAHGRAWRLIPVEDIFDTPPPVRLTRMRAPEPAPAPPAPPSLEMPAPSLREDLGRPPDLTARIDEALKLAFLADDEPGAACQSTLDVLRELVRCESGAALLAGVGGQLLTFRAAFGPVADDLLDTRISKDTGVAGFTYQLGLGVVVNHALLDVRHDKTVDAKLRYTTENVLAVPLKAPSGEILGCVELVNAPGGFLEWHLGAAQHAATRLAAHLDGLGR
ncbi:MAG: GAF domain-containing protein [Alphaproteobacteria bacterium]|nr:GAF domain-containing protein [Alphaproteobacteria bacterium]